jgi:asparagine synthase (glutamine-hydrolysing)
MCGIFGAIRFNGTFNEANWHQFKELTDLVTYRGPDGSGYYCANHKNGSENDKDGFNLFYGHRRLAIIDLSSLGAQPMSKGNLVIIFNGEIYNFLELKSELTVLGCRFETNTDTEVILKIYEIYGEKGFARLNGMWAFAIYDKGTNKVVLSRDRFSEKPIFYYQDSEHFYFSSEIKQLLPLMNNRMPNKRVLVNYLKQGLIDNSIETFFDELYRIESKTNLTIDLNTGKSQKYQYWDYSNTPFSGNPEEEFRYLLEDSVKLRMRSDVPVGCMLSGGLDSSSISVIAHEMNPGIETFSVVSSDKRMSEEAFIDIVVKSKEMKNYRMKFDANHVIQNLDTVLRHQDEPFFNLSVLAGYSILKRIKEDTDIIVLLNGQGGDELLMGYLKYFFFYERDMIKRGQYMKAAGLLFSAIINRTVINQFNLGKAKRYLPGHLNIKSAYIHNTGIGLVDTWTFEDMRHRQILDIDKFSIPSLCRYEDRNSTANSLEMRVPFLDYRLVSFCLNLSTDLKIKNGWTKYILRKVMNDLPKSISYRRDKKGFSVPEENFLRSELRRDILSIKEYSLLDEMGIINKNEFINYYNDFLIGKGQYTEFTDITRVYIAEKWARNNFSN